MKNMVSKEEYDRINNQLKNYKDMVVVMSDALKNIESGSDEAASKLAQDALVKSVAIKLRG
jgi:hypothetical protein